MDSEARGGGEMIGADVIGADVVGADGGKVGKVIAAYAGYVVVEKGFFFPTDYYIPSSAVVSAGPDEVMLNLTKDEALHQGWDAVPASLGGDVAGMVPGEAGNAPMSSPDMTRADRYGHAQPFDHEIDGGVTHDDSGGTITVELHEETATASTRERDLGQVRIEKQIVTEDQTIDVPVIEERIRVERRPVDHAVEAGATLEERTFSVPIRGDVVDVEKEIRVTEEVTIQKEAVERSTTVETTVQHEELRVDDTATTGEGRVTETRGGAPAAPGDSV